MKPTPEQVLSALNKMIKESKTELKAEKVELGLVDDMDTAADRLNDSFGEANKSVKKASNLDDELDKLKTKANEIIRELNGDSSDINKRSDIGKKLLSNFENAAKELGIKPQQSQEYKFLSKLVDQAYERDLTVKDWIRVTKKLV
tara:strand:+ start:80 stop:514 length:435 start_codon:yes stop_codon:yes gene_type:complete